MKRKNRVGFGDEARKKFLKTMPLNWDVSVTKVLFIITVVPGRDEGIVNLLPYFATIKKLTLQTEAESLVEVPKGFLARGVIPPPHTSSVSAGLFFSIA